MIIEPDDTMRIWVDTDFGFDDLWALLLLKHLNVRIDGVSLVAGNTPLPQVTRNAVASIAVFGFEWPVFSGADKPIQREPETAERILGKLGMGSRGLFLPYKDDKSSSQLQSIGAVDAIANWLQEDGSHHFIALGPITNLAKLLIEHPEVAKKIEQITWLGGSRGRGNHSQFAEYNALADPEGLSLVVNSDIPFTMIDLDLCRQVSFGETDIPAMRGNNQQLVSDLLGGYLDIALSRGRKTMSIYDPLAVLAVTHTALFEFVPASLTVQMESTIEYGRTVVDTTAGKSSGKINLAVSIDSLIARSNCMSALVNA